MKIKVEIPNYNPITEIKCNWENGFEIAVKIENGIITLSANREGLISLANHLINLAQEAVPSGCHIHLDEFNSLEEVSTELIFQKKHE